MTTSRADKAKDAPPMTANTGTEYEVSIAFTLTEGEHRNAVAWMPVGLVVTKGGAPTARRKWATSAGDKYRGESLRAVPVSNINEGAFDVAIERKLTPKTTLGTP